MRSSEDLNSDEKEGRDTLKDRIVTQGERLLGGLPPVGDSNNLYSNFAQIIFEIKYDLPEAKEKMKNVRKFAHLSVTLGRGKAVEIFSRKR